jgi:hypothetical protein
VVGQGDARDTRGGGVADHLGGRCRAIRGDGMEVEIYVRQGTRPTLLEVQRIPHGA